MFLARMSESSRTLVYSVAVIGIVAIALLFAAKNSRVVAKSQTNSAVNAVPTATFSADAPSLGGILDSAGCGPTPGTPRNVTFTTSGLSGSVTSVDVSTTFGSPNHTWMGDIIATLIAPNGASHTLFGVTGSTTATGIGDSSDLGGTYVFSDTAPSPPSGGWWQESTARLSTEVMTSGTYRTTASGGAGQTIPAPPTNMNADFAGVTNANGTWTLRLTDGCTGDTGSITAASLSINTGSVTPPADANVDINGDGKTDYVVVRATNSPLSDGSSTSDFSSRLYDPEVRRTPGSSRIKQIGSDNNVIAPPLYWYVSINGSSTQGVAQLGDAATDFVVSEDFDGDGKDDLTVWTEAPAFSANFKILQSSTNTVRVVTFGQTSDDPAVVGDYDGDGKADPAVFRCPQAPAGQCYFFYLGSNNNPSGNITYVPWGFGIDGDFFPYVGDFDGDGKNDFCLQRSNPASPSNGQFVMLKSGGGVEYVNWGLSTDFLIPGDYDGDGKTDLCVRRSNTPTAGLRTYYLLTRTGATSQVQWGISNDFSTPGDYDGDGKTDFAIWRPNVNPDQNFFWVLNSSNGAITQYEWGLQNDFPLAAWPVH